MLVGVSRRRPEMGWSVSGFVNTIANVATSPLTLASRISSSVVGLGVTGARTVLCAAGSIAGAGLSTVGQIAGSGLNAAGTIVKGVVPIVSDVGAIVPALTSEIGPALQNLRPAAAGLAPKPASNLPLYLGAGAAGVVLLLLLMPRRKPPATTTTTATT